MYTCHFLRALKEFIDRVFSAEKEAEASVCMETGSEWCSWESSGSG